MPCTPSRVRSCRVGRQGLVDRVLSGARPLARRLARPSTPASKPTLRRRSRSSSRTIDAKISRWCFALASPKLATPAMCASGRVGRERLPFPDGREPAAELTRASKLGSSARGIRVADRLDQPDAKPPSLARGPGDQRQTFQLAASASGSSPDAASGSASSCSALPPASRFCCSPSASAWQHSRCGARPCRKPGRAVLAARCFS